LLLSFDSSLASNTSTLLSSKGKTTTLSLFVAAMALACPQSGLLFTVYSTSLDRSIELVKAAKHYIEWTQTDAPMEGFNSKLERNNERMFQLLNGLNASLSVIARPKNPESCRGDAPKACIFDEVGFISRKLWDSFAYPLLQVRACATTA